MARRSALVVLRRTKDIFVITVIFIFLQDYMLRTSTMSRGTIANGSQFAGTGPIERTRAAGSFPPKAKDERRKTVEGQLSCEGPSGIP